VADLARLLGRGAEKKVPKSIASRAYFKVKQARLEEHSPYNEAAGSARSPRIH
jgi:hypothetical protein